MRFQSSQLLLGSIFLLQATSIAGLAIPSQDEIADNSVLIPDYDTGNLARSDLLTARSPGFKDKLKDVLKPKKKGESSTQTAAAPSGQTDTPTAGQSTTVEQSSSTGGKTFKDWTKLYKPRADDNQGPVGLEPAVATWLQGPLGGSVASQQFTSFSIDSIKKHKQPVDHAVYKARYSSEGMMLDSMFKDVDMNPTKDQIPTAELMDIGAKKLKSKPKWIFTKKVANQATRDILLDGLQEKYGKGQVVGKTWTISSSSADAIDKKYFDKIMVSPFSTK